MPTTDAAPFRYIPAQAARSAAQIQNAQFVKCRRHQTFDSGHIQNIVCRQRVFPNAGVAVEKVGVVVQRRGHRLCFSLLVEHGNAFFTAPLAFMRWQKRYFLRFRVFLADYHIARFFPNDPCAARAFL